MELDSFSILLIEANERDKDLVRDIIVQIKELHLEFDHVKNIEEAKSKLGNNKINIILLGCTLGDGKGMNNLKALHKEDPGIPIVMLLDFEDDSFGTETLQAGAQDYAAKWALNKRLMTRIIKHAVERHKILSELEAFRNQQLTESEERFKSLFENVPVGLYRTTPEGEVILANPTLFKMLGYSSFDEMAKVNLNEEYFDETMNREDFIKQIEEKNEIDDHEAKWKCLDGRIMYVRESAKAIRNTEGKIMYFEGTVQDYTKRKLSEQQLTRFTIELKRSNEELEDFASIASHDLKEPLRKVIAFCERLSSYKENFDEDGQLYLDRMKASVSRMQQLIDDLLEYSRITTKAHPFQNTNLNQVVKHVLHDLEHTIQAKNGKVDVEELPTIESDSLQMRQLFQNLISNGLKFSNGDNKPEIKITSQKLGNNKWEISFQDNGIGFDEKYIDRVFKPFQRLVGRSEFEGTGIGLAICQKIVVRHEGEITAKSAKGEGAKFIVTLPEKQSKKEPAIPNI